MAFFLNIALVALSMSRLATSRAVFAHYLVGTVYDDHAATDIQDAIAMGLDGFALNVGDPFASYVGPTVASLFNHAAGTNFKLFFSLDLSAEPGTCASDGTTCNGLSAYDDLLNQYLTNENYWVGDDGKPLVSTFTAAGFQPSDFEAWKAGFNINFIPDFDNTADYGTTDWFTTWGGVVDGVFGWEYTWPFQNQTNDGDVTDDQNVLNNAVKAAKSYMIGLSLVHYKNGYGQNLYRRGEETLSIRMQNILAMDPAPLYVEIITWNDGPESHYIGNLWQEADSTSTYDQNMNHTGLQPLISEFANAFRNLDTAFPASTEPIGAMWYKTQLESTFCPSPAAEPDGYQVSEDTLNWAVVMPENSGMTIQLLSNAVVIQSVTAQGGLNHGSTISTGKAISPGPQQLQILDGSGTVVYSTLPSWCVDPNCENGEYNYNPEVVQIVAGSQPGSAC